MTISPLLLHQPFWQEGVTAGPVIPPVSNEPDTGIPVISGYSLTEPMVRNILSGRYGPVCERFRFYLYSPDGDMHDISDSVLNWSQEFDADRDIMRTGSVTIVPRNALYRVLGLIPPNVSFRVRPRDFAEYALLVYHHVRGPNAWYAWPVGAFKLDTTNINAMSSRQGTNEKTYLSFGNNAYDEEERNTVEQWTIPIADYVQFLAHPMGTPYTVATGTGYIDAVRTLITAAGMPAAFTLLGEQILNTSLTTEYTYTWAPEQTWLNVINDLLEGINFYGLYSANSFQLTSGPRRNILANELPTAGWQSTSEPKFMPDDFQMTIANPDRLCNQFTVQTWTGFRPHIESNAQNNSTQLDMGQPVVGHYVSRNVKIDWIHTNVIQDYADFEIRKASAQSRTLVCETVRDFSYSRLYQPYQYIVMQHPFFFAQLPSDNAPIGNAGEIAPGIEPRFRCDASPGGKMQHTIWIAYNVDVIDHPSQPE